MASTIELLDEHNSLLTQWPCDAEFCAALATGVMASIAIPTGALAPSDGDKVAHVRCTDAMGRVYQGPVREHTKQ